MTVIFSFILALALLAGIIYALRHHQERTRQELVAREQPLPPLTQRQSVPVRQAADETPPPDDAPAPTVAEMAPAVPEPPLAQQATTTSKDWRPACQILRDQGRFEEALAVCQQAWPQWQSFEHAARVMRAAVRSHGDDPATLQHWLGRLHQLAAQASFLHDKIDGLPDPSRQLIQQRFTREQVSALEMPWDQLGYRELRLLTKSDRKQLAHWLGEPEIHQSARLFHGKQWLTAIP